jgi:KAP family P-loop domain
MVGKKILLDSPSAEPVLEFERIARGFAAIITESDPNFAIGIFGGWGSGKTTLMNAIMTELQHHADVITVDFNAWRFEREPQLLIPLLDTIRLAVLAHATPAVTAGVGAPDGTGARSARAERLRGAAGRIGKVVRALATGLSGSIGIPGAITINYSADTGFAALKELSDDSGAPEPESLYVAAFAELQTAFKELTENGVGRIVVFVDDLDRCLPDGALAVLESMKLFFDLPGFIFVVGLDEQVILQAVRSKFAPAVTGQRAADGQPASPAAAMDEELGLSYAKKIFQVPYTLPLMLPQQLNELLDAMYKQAKLEPEQQEDIHEHVRPYLRRVAVNARINPREVKRFINAYTLQTIVRPGLEPAVVLALQTMAFRFDWQDAYDAISADPDQFLSDLRRFRRGDQNAFQGSLSGLESPSSELSDYLASPLAEPLAAADSLDPYLSSLRSAHGVDPWFADALGALGRLERALDEALNAQAGSDAPDVLMRRWEELRKTLGDRQLRRDLNVKDQVRSLQVLLETYRSDPVGSAQRLLQVRDETGRLRAALRFARDSARDDRIRLPTVTGPIFCFAQEPPRCELVA